MGLSLPDRFNPVRRLGKGGGGEVWEILDRYDGQTYALKLLAADATADEREALVREAVALSALEGLGLPAIVGFGRLPEDGRSFMIRELVAGRGLDQLIDSGELSAAVAALAAAATQLVILHRSGLFHGDLKPANIVVGEDGRTTLVDLGLSAPWREGGTHPAGLTPRYAAPELFSGAPLTAQGEVYSLGATLQELVLAEGTAEFDRVRPALAAVAKQATAAAPEARHPSAEEFASALRNAAGLRLAEPSGLGQWPVVGLEGPSRALARAVSQLGAGEVLEVRGPEGAGKTLLLRRLAWTLGAEGVRVAWLDEHALRNPEAAEREVQALAHDPSALILLDPSEAEAQFCESLLDRFGGHKAAWVRTTRVPLGEDQAFELPPLEQKAARELLRRSVPSLSERALDRIVTRTEARPGPLRKVVEAIAGRPIVSDADVDAALSGDARVAQAEGESPAELLDRGRIAEAAQLLAQRPLTKSAADRIVRARLALAQGDARTAIELLPEELRPRGVERDLLGPWQVVRGRALIGVGDYAAALAVLDIAQRAEDSHGLEAAIFSGLALGFLGRDAEAVKRLQDAASLAEQTHATRLEALAHVSLGLVLQRKDQLSGARDAYQKAIDAAQRADDASTLATSQLNLAGLLEVEGDLAGAITLFEAAVDMGRRAGRKSTVRQALLNLTSLDLQLGRVSGARERASTLQEEGSGLSANERAQLLGLLAEIAARSGEVKQAGELFESSAEAYRKLERRVDAAEARLEGVIVRAKVAGAQTAPLREQLRQAEKELEDSSAHRALLELARAHLARAEGAQDLARKNAERAAHLAEAGGQQSVAWRALALSADLATQRGDAHAAARARDSACKVLERTAARLPRDLRDVYWSDERRRALKSTTSTPPIVPAENHRVPLGAVENAALGLAATEHQEPPRTAEARAMLDERLAQILAINADLVGEYDLERLAQHVISHAVRLTRAERGLVVVTRAEGGLDVFARASERGDVERVEFSRSVAEKVIESGEPWVTASALEDARMRGFQSVHRLALQSLACVPIKTASSGVLGALYLEAKGAAGAALQSEVPLLRAFANQVAIGLQNTRLHAEIRQRAAELTSANARLAEAQARLKELLGARTQKLRETREELRKTRDALYGHLGYGGMVGTSQSMRQIYSLIDRVKELDVPVLITGESGTGKEIAARAIHEASARKAGKFVAVNCGAIPENLLESELFGATKGAYTGADRERKGLFREAEGGTILLDEIGEMPLKMQAGLLRVLQERKVRPVGGNDELPVDVRVLVATNRDLSRMVEQGRFREDLFYRIQVVELRLPSLRERREDIPQLVDHFLGRFAATYRRERKGITRDALRKLVDFSWPGNVRQLEHVLVNAWVMSDADELEAADIDLPAPSRPASLLVSRPESTSGDVSAARPPRNEASRHRRDERTSILEALERTGWNRVKAAEILAMPRRTFYRRLKQYGIQ